MAKPDNNGWDKWNAIGMGAALLTTHFMAVCTGWIARGYDYRQQIEEERKQERQR